ncbi:hypothetical protein CTAYLR_001205 [Chrysophaeum taylorii]|uniref:Glutamine-dependent NAD(+) synthetase n=1 Tax=Chrysophaeum taylorii TaxID=2483200 RepID=A0AAD7UDT0_9STRA|nr:hypothetical protein CTAYLR_001205 [Chrysophaeum taylorii]
MVRVTAAVPRVKLGDPMGNAEEIEALYAAACDAGSAVCVFPELCVTGYALDDLHQQDTILDEALAALARLKAATAGREGSVLVVGAPVRLARGLYNCAVVLSHGSTLGIVPKSYLPNFREFYESRQFVPASTLLEDDVAFLGETVRASPYTVFACRENPNFTIGVEVCQDLWVPIPPSAFQAWRGATVLVNLSASNITIGKAEYRRQLVAQASAKCYAAYVYVSAGQGESTNDLAWDGQAVIHEAGEPLGETERFAPGPRLLRADVDLDRLLQDRARDMTWLHNGADFRDRVHRVRRVEFSFSPPAVRLAHRVVPKRPYVPSDPRTLSQLCYECYNVQVSGLVQRIRSSGLTKLVIGVSGGLDSTHALLVCCRALDALEYPRANVLAYTMPGFATGATTKAYALDLMAALGVDAREIDIRPSCDRMLLDIGHPYAVDGEPAYDVTFENVQAGERTSHLFRLANHHGAFVVGTGDLSELALGWCTYGVGDHMSHYSVNASLSKSLIQCVIQWVIDETFFGDKVNAVLSNVLAVEISPELVPPSDGKNIQSTEAAIGPYDLHDFQLYHATRRGLSAPKAAFLAAYAWARDIPRASDARPVEPQPSLTGAKSILKDRDFALAEILDFQRAFFRRFFLTTQFKRTCIPNAPKVADGGSLSPRGDWRAPSDSSWAAWNRAWLRTATWALDSARDLNTEGGADLLPALQALVDKHRPP